MPWFSPPGNNSSFTFETETGHTRARKCWGCLLSLVFQLCQAVCLLTIKSNHWGFLTTIEKLNTTSRYNDYVSYRYSSHQDGICTWSKQLYNSQFGLSMKLILNYKASSTRLQYYSTRHLTTWVPEAFTDFFLVILESQSSGHDKMQISNDMSRWSFRAKHSSCSWKQRLKLGSVN